MADNISCESWVNVLCFLPPKDFISFRKISKRFTSLSKCSQNVCINKYWQDCCNQFCDEIASDYSTNNWEIFYKELKYISIQMKKEYIDYCAKNNTDNTVNCDDENKNDNCNDETNMTNTLSSSIAITLHYKNTAVFGGENTDDNKDTDAAKSTFPNDDIITLIEQRTPMSQFMVERYENAQEELIKFKKYNIGYLQPLLIECVKYDCVNVFDMLLHHENYHVNMMIDAVDIYTSIRIEKVTLKSMDMHMSEGKSDYFDLPVDEQFKYVTPLILACEYGSINIVKLLLTNVKYKNEIDFTIVKGLPSWWSSFHSYTNDIRPGEKHDKLEMQNALLSAILCGHEQIASILIEHEKIPQKIVFDDARIFYFACAKCLPKLVKILLNKGVNPNIVTLLGVMPGDNRRDYKIEKLAINCVIAQLANKTHEAYGGSRLGANYLYDRDRSGNPRELFDLLVNDRNIDLNCQDPYSGAPLIAAMSYFEPNKDSVEIIQCLINNGADVNEGIPAGWNPQVCVHCTFCLFMCYFSFVLVLIGKLI